MSNHDQIILISGMLIGLIGSGLLSQVERLIRKALRMRKWNTEHLRNRKL